MKQYKQWYVKHLKGKPWWVVALLLTLPGGLVLAGLYLLLRKKK